MTPDQARERLKEIGFKHIDLISIMAKDFDDFTEFAKLAGMTDSKILFGVYATSFGLLGYWIEQIKSVTMKNFPNETGLE